MTVQWPEVGWEVGSGLVFKKEGLWYHVDEIWCDTYGPFKDKEEAIKALHKYAEHLEEV